MKRNPGMRLFEESIQQLKELAEKNKRSMANMVEILIQNEYEKGNKSMTGGYNYYRKENDQYVQLTTEERNKYTTGAYTCILEQKVEDNVYLCTMELCGMTKHKRDTGNEKYKDYKDLETVYKIIKK